MKKPIAISLSPNTTSQDVWQAARVLTSPTTWRDDTYIHEVRDRLSALLPGRTVIPTSSGRQALYDILRAYGIGQGDEVILQAFTCIAVPESILWAGATPIYADIDQDTYNTTLEHVQARVTAHTKAIIIQHTFGIPGPIDEIVAFAHKQNIVVIEDCAHALGTTIGGRAAGTIGDAAVVTFGRDKMVSSVFGGAAVVRDVAVATRVASYVTERPYPPTSWIVQQLMHPILFAAIIPTYFMGIGKALLVAAQKLGILSKAVETSERTGVMPTHVQWRYSPALAQLVIPQLELFPKTKDRRQSIAQRYRAALAKTPAVLPRVPDNTDPSWLRFPLQVQSRDKLMEQAKNADILLGDWYDAALVPGDFSPTVFRYTAGMCPVAERVAQHVVNLPTYSRLSDEQVERIIRICMETYEH